MKWEDIVDKVITFQGCWFSAGWEFDHPIIIYSPVKRYGFATTFENMVEDVIIDMTVDGEVEDGFSEDDLKEFNWRRWDPKGFKKRKNAHHETIKVRFFIDQDGEKECEYLDD